MDSSSVAVKSLNKTAVDYGYPGYQQLALQLLQKLFLHRRFTGTNRDCHQRDCLACLKPHLAKVKRLVKSSQPIELILPAFPGKSPNRRKVTGVLPDEAERLALLFLNRLCEELSCLYSPGVRLIICSDGRMFSDVVGMRDDDVRVYQAWIDRMIEDNKLNRLSTFHLDHIVSQDGLADLSREITESFGPSIESIREKVKRGAQEDAGSVDLEHNRLLCGMTRFLVEDADNGQLDLSRTALQKQSRARAYEVIRRSQAWGDFLKQRYPEAIRLSIHPQTCGAAKIGIKLIENESWLTPWHGVAVETSSGFILMKRWQALEQGAVPVVEKGRITHYRFTESSEEGLS